MVRPSIGWPPTTNQLRHRPKQIPEDCEMYFKMYASEGQTHLSFCALVEMNAEPPMEEGWV